ncbi:hypothetical protein [Phenylobacterium sp.]|jgi:hypothetical protein|uniref:hypothetical protein n=1 Tax=Phenylobacterium sp. TaxID=1871053 RepID=UPI002E33FFCC|nr:hypothetical protein [Phenylobacterium sp.]HEX3364959.1 hypothetical protein [Phenylobacterium sp.]
MVEGAVRLRGAVRLAFGAALAAYGTVAGWLVWRTSILEAYSDMYDWVARWRVLQAGGGLGRYFWAPHNFHHLVWTFAVLDLDIRVFGAKSYLFLAVGVACLATVAAMLAWAGAAAAGRGLRLVGAGVAAALCLMGCNVLDATADINTTYVHALVFAVAAILLAEAPGGRRRLRLVAALVCAAAAGLGSAAGLAVWPALLFGAWRKGDRVASITVAAAGGAFSLLYLVGQAPGAGSAAVGAGLAGHFAEAGALALNYLGLPWVRALPALGWAFGLAILAVSLAALAFKARRGADWSERAAVSLIVFSLTTAAMASMARTGIIAPSLVPMRYSVFLAPLHVGLWLLALPWLRRAWTRRPRASEAMVVAASVFLLAHQGVMAVYAVRTADANLRFIADFREGRRYPQMQPIVYGDISQVLTLADWMKREDFYQRELRPDPAGGTPQWIGYFGFMDWSMIGAPARTWLGVAGGLQPLASPRPFR